MMNNEIVSQSYQRTSPVLSTEIGILNLQVIPTANLFNFLFYIRKLSYYLFLYHFRLKEFFTAPKIVLLISNYSQIINKSTVNDIL